MTGQHDFEALASEPHRRYNPLTRDWVLVSPQRALRPWQGQSGGAAARVVAPYDPACHLCPGNERASGVRNPRYDSTLAFDNDFSALAATLPWRFERGLLRAESEFGVCRVLCFSPRHDLSLAQLGAAQREAVVALWVSEYERLLRLPGVGYVQIFENRGAMMGASSPHPHGQVWASASLPNEPAKEQAALEEFAQGRGECLLCAYARFEAADGQRVVLSSGGFLVVVPFWAVWPFETLLVPRRHRTGLDVLGSGERRELARVVGELTALYDAVFDCEFPYSMGFHQRPVGRLHREEWHMHAHFFPPLLRSATIRKFMVGYEQLASPQRDLTPEQAAARLREVQARANARSAVSESSARSG